MTDGEKREQRQLATMRGETYEPDGQTLAVLAAANAPDLVNHPPHYKSGGMEAIDVIEAFDLGFCLGNTVKYVLRAGRKSGEKTLVDLAKARWYLDREIARLEREKK